MKDITDWNDWRQWQVSVDYLEEITGYDFLSNVPQAIQTVIES
jgi:endonuclease G